MPLSKETIDTDRMMLNPELIHQFNAYVKAFAIKTGKNPWKNVYGDQIFRAADDAAVKFDIASSDSGALGNNIVDGIQKIAINFLVQKIEPKDVPDTIRQCFAFNHHNAHWTAVVVSSENFKESYKKIYDACISSVISDANSIEYNKQDFLSGNNALECALGIRDARTLKEIITSSAEQRKIYLNTFTKNIRVKHYDSTHATRYFDDVEKDLASIASHVSLSRESCALQTSLSNTCGDHTLYNLFTNAMLNKAPDNEIQSEQLRAITQTLSNNESLKKIIELMNEQQLIRSAREKKGKFRDTKAMAKTNALISKTAQELKRRSLTRTEYHALEEIIEFAQNAEPPLITTLTLKSSSFTDALVNVVQNKMVDAILSFKTIADYASIDIIHLIIHNPEMADELNFKKFLIKYSQNRNDIYKNTQALDYSLELQEIVKNIATLVKGEITLSADENPTNHLLNATEKTICKSIAKLTAEEFCLHMMQEQFNSLETTDDLLNEIPLPPPGNKADLPPTKTETPPQVAIPIAPITPHVPIAPLPPITSLPPKAAIEPVFLKQNKSTLFRDIGISVGVSSVTGTVCAIAIGLFVGASIAMPLLIGAAVAIALLGTLIGTIVSAVKNKNNEAKSTTAKNGSYSLFSEKMPLLNNKDQTNTKKAGIDRPVADNSTDNNRRIESENNLERSPFKPR